jgi:hypothetical protein
MTGGIPLHETGMDEEGTHVRSEEHLRVLIHRWHRGGHHDGVVALSVAVCDRTKFEFYLQAFGDAHLAHQLIALRSASATLGDSTFERKI